MTTITMSIPGEPRGWARARASAVGRFVRMHNPKGNDEWRALVQQVAVAALPAGWVPTREPVVVRILARWSRPASHAGKKGLRKSAPVHRTGKPDLDNLAKGLLDSLNGIVWHDDAQVVLLTAGKRWARQDESPGTDVRVTVEGQA